MEGWFYTVISDYYRILATTIVLRYPERIEHRADFYILSERMSFFP